MDKFSIQALLDETAQQEERNGLFELENESINGGLFQWVVIQPYEESYAVNE